MDEGMASGEGEDQEVLAAQARLRKLVDSRPEDMGHFIHGRDALMSVDRLDAKAVRQTTSFRGLLKWGTLPQHDKEDKDRHLDIPVFVYNKTTEMKIPSAKKWSLLAQQTATTADTDTYGAVLQERVLKLAKEKTASSDEESESEDVVVEREDLVRAYRYGKDWVPFTEADEEAAKLRTEKAMTVIAVTAAANVPHQYYMGGVLAITPDPSSTTAYTLLRSFSEAMREQSQVAIVRYCRTEDAPPRLGALIPNIKGYFYFVQIPYQDDMRNFSFPPIDFLTNPVVHSKSALASKTKSKKGRSGDVPSSRHHPLDSRTGSREEVMAAMDALIDSMDLSGDHDRFWPKRVLNPSYQRLYQCIVHRCLYPDSKDLPPPPPALEAMLGPVPEFEAASTTALARLAGCFTLQPVEKIVKGRVKRSLAKTLSHGVSFDFLSGADEVGLFDLEDTGENPPQRSSGTALSTDPGVSDLSPTFESAKSAAQPSQPTRPQGSVPDPLDFLFE
ncbi:X-ray repair cross-complementing protein 5 [Kappamyces sp. JEL0680]|nr:X-ray repair cross-complementing protein 5 [Kappamyces sp. JEL0680]